MNIVEQSGAICLNGHKVVLVTSSSGKRWVIPKGHLEASDHSSRSRAKAEAWEEAGVTGEPATEPLGTFDYSKKGKTHRVEVFLMENCLLADDWPEAERRQRVVVPLDLAIDFVDEPELKAILRELTAPSN